MQSFSSRTVLRRKQDGRWLQIANFLLAFGTMHSYNIERSAYVIRLPMYIMFVMAIRTPAPAARSAPHVPHLWKSDTGVWFRLKYAQGYPPV